jgi:hypothetical protein
MFSKVGDYRVALLCAAFLFVPAAIALMLPEPPDEPTVVPDGEKKG